MTLQEIFDKSVGGVIAQGGPGVMWCDEGSTCVYLADDGKKCAAGQLLSSEALERTRRQSFGSLFIPGHPDPMAGVADLLIMSGITLDQFLLVGALQKAHDDNSRVSDFLFVFKVAVEQVAADYSLEFKF